MGVYASDDPAAAGYFKWPLEDPAAAGFHAFRGCVDIAGIEVIKPIWNRLYRTFSEHAADRLPAGGEQQIHVRLTGFGVLSLPAKELAVECKRLLPIAGEQLMPTHAPRFVQLGGLLLTGFLPIDQRKYRRLRVGDDRNTADVAVRRRHVHGSTKIFNPVGRSVHVVDPDISHPPRRRAHFLRVFW